jgi:uncharacterized protein (TIGR02145 family)
MKTTYGWFQGSNGTNSSGFSGLPGGSRYYYGPVVDAGFKGNWWSSSPNGSNAWCRYLVSTSVGASRTDGSQSSGFSVRCVRDAK